ncbi:MAG: glucose-6-phosphate isomerase [Pseudomonadota bacterium]
MTERRDLRQGAWRKLDRLATETPAATLRDLFDRDPERGPRYSFDLKPLRVDLSRHPLDEGAWETLLELGEACDLAGAASRMAAGEVINVTEGRPALHSALRYPPCAAGAGVAEAVGQATAQLCDLADRMRGGRWVGTTGQVITDLVNIGIGGSDLGPRLVVNALSTPPEQRVRVHFVANIDGMAMADTLASLNPATTAFCITSKSFGTRETLTNATTARSWLKQALATEALEAHLIAVSANVQRAAEFGVQPDNVLPMWDWVGGRYSLWSAVGLPIAVALGSDGFRALLDGAALLDEHFFETPLEHNLPMRLALAGVWQRQVGGATGYAVVPYANRLGLLPDWLQQLDMESNGKRVDIGGSALNRNSGALCWGGVGTDGQHAYFQWLHQGTSPTPVEFIGVKAPGHGYHDHHQQLLANLLGQATALAFGRSAEETRDELLHSGKSPEEADRLAPHMTFPGNRASTIIMLDELSPAALGALLALYEHRVYAQSVLWNNNAFDQWGVELGKTLALNVESQLAGEAAEHPAPGLDHWLAWLRS